MAEMIPDKLPSRASKGEEKLFSILKRLPDDYIIYYEPIVENRYPDFIVICPNLGLLVIEVKGWYPKDIIAASSNAVMVRESGNEVCRNHPVRQARDYMWSLVDECRNHRASQSLLHKEGDFQNRFIFPFGHFAVLSNITSTQLKNHQNGDFTRIFPPDKVVTRDVLESWLDETLSPEQLCKVLRSFFDPFWTTDKLTEYQINTLRAVIHPEIVIKMGNSEHSEPLASEEQVDLKVLDLRQENNARQIGDGHRIIYGVAGSGKTVLLIAKARLLSSQKPDVQILLLCYNVALAAYLKDTLKGCKNIKVLHFDGWAKANGVVRQRNESDEDLGNRLLNVLEEGADDSQKYDAVMVDEAQDFEVSWFKCILSAMKEPYDGDLIIVADGSQGLYSRRNINWKEIGINARGRTISAKLDLDKNYRNSREIIELAAVFASQSEGNDEDTILSILVNPNKCKRSTGVKPVLVKSRNKREELTKVLSIVKNLLDGQWFGRQIEPLQPKDIAIFYPLAFSRDRAILSELVDSLKEITPVIWLTNPDDWRAKHKVSEPSVKIQTINSAKGLQYRAVILMWADELPKQFENSDELKDRRLLYVGLTRPEDFLAVSASGSSKFLTEIENSGKIVIASTDVVRSPSLPIPTLQRSRAKVVHN